MATKVCTGCEKEKPETEFHWRNQAAGARIARCRTCCSDYTKSHYNKNKKMYLGKAARWAKRDKRESQQKVFDYLKTHPCVDCGESDPIVLEFDHVRDRKIASISYMVSTKRFSWARIEEEIKKCDVRCANCHRRKTAKQFQFSKLLLV